MMTTYVNRFMLSGYAGWVVDRGDETTGTCRISAGIRAAAPEPGAGRRACPGADGARREAGRASRADRGPAGTHPDLFELRHLARDLDHEIEQLQDR